MISNFNPIKVFSRFKFFILILILSGNCIVLDEIGLESNDSMTGKEAKKEISQATTEAVANGQLLWLAQKGMQSGIPIVTPLTALNGFLAGFLYPIISEIEDEGSYLKSSVYDCTSIIRGKATIYYGVFLDSLPPGNAISSSVRDAYLIPNIAECELEKTGIIISFDPVIKL
ncbi:TIGR04452 family lipoprotein [Leptospira sp. GIMC2001]|uniref:TIGR04452 family lipoprotein n=1 Tax=Leptospira sp. GIMC2001 TaxID=1513297 RepID=UPI00234A076E|nr:TIGR04452 family lipoprotein [Leptospira sp. GIMC2001]WCL49929.1 TIGR04452 family lipoprotein [Leptospira sp. GIMC2001]